MTPDFIITAEDIDYISSARYLTTPDSLGRQWATATQKCASGCVVAKLEYAAHDDDGHIYSYPYTISHGMNFYESDRYKTAAEMADALTALLTEHTTIHIGDTHEA